MTGEISLRGRVLPIGGLREKTMAAYTHHMKTVVIPVENEPDLSEVDDVVKQNIHFVPAEHLDAVIHTALVRSPETAPLPGEAAAEKPVPDLPIPPAAKGKPASVTQ